MGAAKRDSRIDFWRGFALLTIFVNHIPGNAFESFTHKNFGYSDAAELFVLLAGMSAALAYFPRFINGEPLRQAYRALQRSFGLYLAHVTTLVAAGAIFALAVIRTGDPRLLELINIGHLFTDPLHTIVGVATLGYQPAYFNILPLYTVLLALLPVLMMLARFDLSLALAGSASVYLAAQLIGFSLPHYPLSGPWFLNPFAWQLLFTLGFAAGAAILSGRSVRFRPALFWLAAGYLVLSLVCVRADLRPEPDLLPLPHFLWYFDKGELPIPRLLHVLALAYVVAHLPVSRWLARLASTNPIVLLGRHALPVFCVGSLLSALGQVLQFTVNRGIVFDVVYISAGIAVQVGLARVLEWNRGAAKNEERQDLMVEASQRAS